VVMSAMIAFIVGLLNIWSRASIKMEKSHIEPPAFGKVIF
jgi:hypothetical protein